MHERPDQPPEGRLIQEAMQRAGLSSRKAAIQAGISDARWRHIINGYQPAGRGEYVTVVAPAATLARMANAVGLDPQHLRAAGRGDAADELEHLQAAPPVEPSSADRTIAEQTLREIAVLVRSKLLDSTVRQGVLELIDYWEADARRPKTARLDDSERLSGAS